MKYEEIRHLSEEQFRGLTGVKRLTFTRMTENLHKEFVIEKAVVLIRFLFLICS
jgi:hypothetical protein